MDAAKTYTDFKSNYNISAFNERRTFLVSFLLLFLRRQILEAIAAIFWQSNSYVFEFHFVERVIVV